MCVGDGVVVGVGWGVRESARGSKKDAFLRGMRVKGWNDAGWSWLGVRRNGVLFDRYWTVQVNT